MSARTASDDGAPPPPPPPLEGAGVGVGVGVGVGAGVAAVDRLSVLTEPEEEMRRRAALPVSAM